METSFWDEIQETPGEIFDLDYDDMMTAEDYDRREAIRNGWVSDTQGRY